MKELLPMLKNSGRLVAVAIAAAFILALTDSVTRAPIQNYREQKKIKARNAVLPADLYVLSTNRKLSSYAAKGYTNRQEAKRGLSFPRAVFQPGYYRAYNKKTNTVGFVYQMTAPDGYAGKIDLTVGVKLLSNKLNGKPVINDYRVISSAETPGLGKAAEKKLHIFFTNKNKGIDSFSSDPQKDAVSGATITSVAIKDALYKAVLATEVKLKEEYYNLALPEDHLKILPYTRGLVRQNITNLRTPLKELYEARFFYRVMGLSAKLYFESGGKKYIAVMGIQPVFNRLYTLRLYEMRYDASNPFQAVPVDARPYMFATPEILKSREPLMTGPNQKPLIKDLYNAVVKSVAELQRTGRMK